MVKRLIIIAVVIAAVGGGWWAWTTYGPEPGATADRLGGSGIVEANEIAISSVIAGRIASTSAEEGALVASGTALFELDSVILRLQVDQAQAGVKAAQAALDKAKVDKVTQAEIDQAVARVDQAAAALEMAKVQLEYSTVSAPIAGTITGVSASVGENAAPGKTLATIADLSDLYVDVYIPETLIGQVKVGMKASVTTDSSTRAFEGTVVRIASEAEFTPSNVETKDQRVKLVYEVRLTVTDEGFVLKPGMPVDVAF